MSFLSFRSFIPAPRPAADRIAPWLAEPHTPAAVPAATAGPVIPRRLIERVLDEGGRRHFEPMREAVVLDLRSPAAPTHRRAT